MANQHRPIHLLSIHKQPRQPYPVFPIDVLLYTAAHNPKVVALGRPEDLVLRFPRQLHLYLDLARKRTGIERDVNAVVAGLRMYFCGCSVESSVAVAERRFEIIDFSRCGVESGVAVPERTREIMNHFL